MKALEIQQATAPLADYVRNINEEPVIVSVGGRPVAALVPIQNADWETARLSTDPQFLALIQRSRSRQEKEGGIPGREMRRRLGIGRAGKGPTPRGPDRKKRSGR